MKNVLPLSDNEFDLFQRLLIEECGFYFDKDKLHALNPALWERLQKKKMNSYLEYYNYLRFYPDRDSEFKKLYNLITIGETYFFRSTPHFEVLRNHVLPEIIKRKECLKNKFLRIWSSGCSRGDEAYSLAIALVESLPFYKEWEISILGTDINEGVLEQAKKGIYNKRDISHLSSEYLNKYFVFKDDKYILDEKIKSMVKFEYHNLVKDPFTMEEMQNLDIIFCRNVTIYFDLNTTRLVIDKFYNCLSDEGYLFIGHAESLWQITDKFKVVEFPQTFIYKKSILPVAEDAPAPFMEIPEINIKDYIPVCETALEELPLFTSSETYAAEEIEKDIEAYTRKEIETEYKEALELFNKNRYHEALVLLDKVISKDKNFIHAYFVKATIFANQGKYEDAIKELKKLIEIDNLYLDSYYLLGVLLYKNGDFINAETQFRKVIYINPGIVITYFDLGNIYLYQKKYSKAVREFNNAVRLLEKMPAEEHIRFCEDFTAEFLLRICKNRILKLKTL
ncbi:tetratricopeptide repeat protein, partial [Candidatus Poribacteria bacterium]|nr:tetratricopeptide repeat protein [Candidatus Poribacteria bacterium]